MSYVGKSFVPAVFLTFASLVLHAAPAEEPSLPVSTPLSIDSRLTTRSVLQLAPLGRCVDVWDFAELLGVEKKRQGTGKTQSISLVSPEDKASFVIGLSEGNCLMRGERLYAPLGFLTRKLGFRVETDPRGRYFRVLSSSEAISRAQFLALHAHAFDVADLTEAVRRRDVHAGILAVNGRLLEKAHTLRIDGKTFFPLNETTEELVRQGVPGDLSYPESPNKIAWRVVKGFSICVDQARIEHQGVAYIEDSLMKKAFKARVKEISAESLGVDVHVTSFSTGERVSATEGVSFSGASWDRALAHARRSEARLFKRAYLTFDDGPSRSVTPQILDILKAHGLRATFFVLGKEVAARPEILKRLRSEGHIVANHTYSHRRELIYRSVKGLMDEIGRTDDLFQEVLGERSKMFRAPYGAWGNLKAEHYESLHKAGYKIYNWNVDAGDSSSTKIKAADIVKEFRKQIETKTEALILFHDSASKQETVKALPEVIKILREKGFEILPLQYETEIRGKGIVQ